MHALSSPIFVLLLDTSTKTVHKIGNIYIKDVPLYDMFYLPEFQYNLLSVSKLLKTTSIHLIFYSSCCLFQDLQTKEILVVAQEVVGLYRLDKSSFLPFVINNTLISLKHSSLYNSTVNTMFSSDSINKENLFQCSKSMAKVNIHTLHARLGHISLQKLQHLPNYASLIK